MRETTRGATGVPGHKRKVARGHAVESDLQIAKVRLAIGHSRMTNDE